MTGEPPRDDEDSGSAPPATPKPDRADVPAEHEWPSRPPHATGLDGVLRGGTTPSFFPDDDADLDAYLDQLLPSLAPSTPEPRPSDSGLRAALPVAPVDVPTDDISHIVTLRDAEAWAQGESLPAAFSSSDALSLLALDERGIDIDAAAPVDEAALATLTSLPRRALHVAPNPLGLDDVHSLNARAMLLEHLAGQTTRATQTSRLLGFAAELQDRRGDAAQACELRARAALSDPTDLHALRETRRDAARALDFARVAESLAREAALLPVGSERALVLTLLAELRGHSLGDPQGAIDAAREALHSDPGALPAALLLHELLRSAGDTAEAADVLATAAEQLHDGPLRAGILCHAARLVLRTGSPALARSRFERAVQADPESTEAQLGLFRAARAQGDLVTAVQCLGQLAAALPDAARAELFRRRSTLELWRLADPRAALESLAHAEGVAALRAAQVAAHRCGDTERRMAALERWVAQPTQRSLGLLELGHARFEAGEFDAAAALFDQAAEADPELNLVRVAQQVLARQRGDVVTLASAVGDGGEHNALGAAAKLGAGVEVAQRERELLLSARTELDDKATTEALVLDTAAQAGDLEGVRRGLWTRAERGLSARRVGPLTTLIDLEARGVQSEAVREVLRLGLRASAGSTAMLRQALDAERDVEARAALWRAEASRVHPARAAFAQTMAARELAGSGHDAAGAYEAALGSLPGYGPAAWELEVEARRAGYSDALVHMHDELAKTEPDDFERRTRRVRSALLYAGSNATLATQYLSEALTTDRSDPIVVDLIRRLNAPGGTRRIAEALDEVAAASSPRWRRANTLLAAEALAETGALDAAAAHCRHLLEADPHDPLAASTLQRVLEALPNSIPLRTWLAERVARAATSSERAHALEHLAHAELRAGDIEAAILALEQQLLDAPGEVAALRMLERLAMQSDRRLALARYADALANQLTDPADRSAELWLELRLRDQAKTRNQADLDSLTERLISLGRVELWAAVGQEELARRTGRPHAIADATARLATLLSDPDERASLAMRAAEALEPMSSTSALDALEDDAAAAPNHPLAMEEVGRLAEHSGQLERALEAFANAAARAQSEERRLRLWYRVAVLAHDRLGHPTQAIDALERVVALDVLYREAFSRLRALYRGTSDRAKLIRLYQRRLERGAQAALAAELNTEICTHALELGDRDTAKRALAAAMQSDPEHIETQKALAALHLADGEHRAAADVLVRVARSTDDTTVLLWAFRELGALYDGPMADLKRAQVAYTRVLAYDPENEEAIERLASIFERSAQLPRALRAWQTLADRQQEDPVRWERCMLHVARLLERDGKVPAAERLLEQLRTARPTSLEVVEALSRHYAAQDAQPSVLVHLDRSIHSFRSAVRDQPGSSEAWRGLISTLHARAHRLSSDACRAAALGLGVEGMEAPAQPPLGLGERVRTSHSAQRATPRQWTAGLRTLFAAAAPALDLVVPHPTDDASARPLRALPDDLAEQVRRVSRWFGLPVPSIQISPSRVCLCVREQPFTLLIGEPLLEGLTTPQLTYLVARAAAQASEHLSFVARATPEQLDLTLRALLLHLDPSRSTASEDREALDERAAALAVHLADRSDRLRAGAFELASAPHIDVLSLTNLAMEVGARSALLATADLGAALRALARCRANEQAPLNPLQLVHDDAEADALLYFVVSDHYLAAIEEAGA